MSVKFGSDDVSVNMVREVQVLSEENAATIGNALRKANAYTYSNNISGLYQLIDSSNYVLQNAIEINSNCQIENQYGSYIIIDGKLYRHSVEDQYYVLTQEGTDTDWERLYGAGNYEICVKGNKIYPSLYAATNNLNNYIVANGVKFYHTGSDDSREFINDGKLYYCHGDNSFQIIDDTGVWTDLIAGENSDYGGYGVRDGKVTRFERETNYDTNRNHILKTLVTVSDIPYPGIKKVVKYYAGIAIADGNVLHTYQYNSSSKTFSDTTTTYDSNIIGFHSTGGNIGTVILENSTNQYGDYVIMNSGFAIINHNNTALYRVGSSTPFFQSETPFSIVPNENNSANSSWSTIAIRFGNENAMIYKTVFVPNVIGTKAYDNTSNMVNYKTITSSNGNELYINSERYMKDVYNDSTFSFIPNELKTHTFSDQEMCQACLEAGLNI